jgi:hypothetical protein
MENPKLRDVELLPVREDLYALRDPLRYTDKILLLPAAILGIIALLDGSRSPVEAQYEFTRRHGGTLPGAKVREIIQCLDENGFLESESFIEWRKKVDRDFSEAAIRAAAHAGSGYESEPDALRRMLDGLFEEIAPEEREADGALLGVIAPHIDIRRGGSCYARAYERVKRLGGAARTIVLLGISHVQTKNRYVLTAKDFQTPLGTLPTDTECVRKLADECGFDPFEDEIMHRSEHSLEFQAVFLRHIFQDRGDIRIVPVLCGPLLADQSHAGSPMSDPQAAAFISALRRLLIERRQEVLLIAGADLCHVGRRFGDRVPFTERFIADARAADREMLGAVTRADAEGFIGFIQREGDRRKVCGVPAIYTMLSALNPAGVAEPAGRLLAYDMAVDREGESAVGFAAVSFRQR